MLFYYNWKLRDKPVQTGKESLIGRIGVVRLRLNPRGIVQLHGELWSAQSKNGETFKHGERVRVVDVKGLYLIVESADQTQSTSESDKSE